MEGIVYLDAYCLDLISCLATSEQFYWFLGKPSSKRIRFPNPHHGDGFISGHVEVFHEGEWGTVCDDKFDNRDAQVSDENNKNLANQWQILKMI